MMDSNALLQDFITETEEHLEEMERNLLRLEIDSNNPEILNEIFRSAHTIKGAAEYLGIEKIAGLSHQVESLLELLRQWRRPTDKAVIDTLMAAKDRIARLIKDLGGVHAEEIEIADLVKDLEQLSEGPDQPGELQRAEPLPDIETQPVDPNPPLSDDLQGIFNEQAQKNYTLLETSLSEMAEDGVTPERTEQLRKGFDEFIRISHYVTIQDLIPNLERLKEEGVRVSSPNEAKELISSLRLLKDLLPRAETAISVVDPGEEEAPLSPALEKEDPLKEALVEDPKGSGQEISSRPEQSETYEEEHDQELFSIFIQHLKDHLRSLSIQAAQLDTSDHKTEVLDQCLEWIKGLKSSANYMDYKKLVILYENWTAEIGRAKDRLSQGTEVSFRFMEDYFNKVSTLFPQCGYPHMKDGKAPASISPSDASLLSPNPKVEKEVVIDSLELETDRSPIEQGLLTELETVLSPISEGTPPPANKSVPQETVETHSSPREMRPLPSPPDGKEEATPVEAANLQETSPSSGSEEEAGSPQPPLKEPSSDGPSERVVKHNLRVDTKKIDVLMNQVGELVVNRAWFSQLAFEIKDLQRELQEGKKLDQRESKQFKNLAFRVNEATLALGRVANELQEGVMKVRMLPIAQLFSRYPRLVRQLVQGTGKQVHLEISGEETELDKMVIEEVSDPLIHIIRNAVDHGIESVEERRRLNKPEEGKIRLAAYHESNHVVIEMTDDGRGIDPKLLKETALNKGFFSESELDRMTHKELLNLIMKPGFSTATQVTKTSGRGVGMDVVKKNIEKLNGTIEIDSTPGMGTRFRIKIPLTLAIIQALLVRVGPETFTIPLTSVVETLRLFKEEINTIEGVEVIHLRQSTIPLLRLSKIFKIPDASHDSPKAFVVIISAGVKQVGLVVDSLVGEHEVVIKPLVDYLQENSGFSGATILGDGRISLILDVYELVKLAVGRQVKWRNHINPGAGNMSPAEKQLSGAIG